VGKPVVQDIDVVRGDDIYMYFGVKRNGVRIDLTGIAVTGDVRTTEDADKTCSWTCVLADQVADMGGVLCHIDKADSALFTVTQMYDIQVDFPADRKTVIKGKLNVTKDVTHG
jgi:hypothetical protein